ncbi:MAG: aspartate-semialdehyde dehydrogenase [Bacteroidota bacterium]|nr:aspartate-semialdehyde dehydrogenase [Bacteroidota bacterium]
MRLAVVGVTGMVGQIMLKILFERNIKIKEFFPVASKKSVGKKITFGNKKFTIIGLNDVIKLKPDVALFSAGGSVSMEWAPKFSKIGCKVIDNSSAWRMKENIKLIIPEINASILKPSDTIISNPNCSTIQMLMAIAPIHKIYNIQRVVVSTYQSITGTGMKAVRQLESELNDEKKEMIYPHQIHKNALPHCDVFLENGYTKEEMKLVNETHKILDSKINVTATAVRIPVVGGHSESINLTLTKPFETSDILELLSKANGVVVQDNPQENHYPMPIKAEGKDDVFVGRIRRDNSQNNGLNLWVVSDNLRKGAATNTVQILEYLIEKNWV